MDHRAEGVYPVWIKYPPEPLIGATDLLQVERVNGDSSVSSVTLTVEETKKLLSVINEKLT